MLVSEMPDAQAIPPALAKYGKYLWYVTKSVAEGIIWQQFEQVSEMKPTPIVSGGDPPDTWRRIVFRFECNATLDTADTQQFSVDLVKWNGTSIDSNWSTTDYQTATNFLRDIVDSWKAALSNNYTCRHIYVYKMAFNDLDYVVIDEDGKEHRPPFADTGAPVFISNVTLTGTGTAGMANQVCSTITEITASRRNWGRIYTPTLAAVALTNAGRVNNGTVDLLAGSWDGLLLFLSQKNLALVVPTTSVDKHRTRTLQAVSGVRVDDVPDIQRRRRYRNPVYRKSFP